MKTFRHDDTVLMTPCCLRREHFFCKRELSCECLCHEDDPMRMGQRS